MKLRKILLPGAERFSRFLEARLGGNLTAKGPEVVDRSYDMDFTKVWKLYWNGEKIGKYCTFGPKPGETEMSKEYSGRIPGYVNDCTVLHNKSVPISEREPIDVVSLSYSDKSFEFVDEAFIPDIMERNGDLTSDMLKGFERKHRFRTGRYIGEIVKTPWQRQDGHTRIPFP